MSYRSLSPITGYTGHIPGEKWVVGTNARRSRSWHRAKQPMGGIGPIGGEMPLEGGIGVEGEEAIGREKKGKRRRRKRKEIEEEEEEEGEMMANEVEGMKLMDEIGSDEREEEEEHIEEGMDEHIEEERRHSNSKEAQQMAKGRRRISRQSSAASSLPPQSAPSTGGRSKKSSMSRKSAKSTSRSSKRGEGEAGSTRTMSPKNEGNEAMEGMANGIGPAQGGHRTMDAFADIQPGWWSEGQALKNLRAHRRAMEGGWTGSRQRKSEPTIVAWEGGNEEGGTGRREAESAPLGTPTKDSTILEAEIGDKQQDIPTPGYSGHLTELYQTSVGKSFGMAAKESKMRQKRYQDGLSSGGRTFLSSSGSSGKGKSNKEREEDEGGGGDFEGQKVSPY